ncbi:MAG: rod shape-determining protein MreD [Gammaproteobacteria bacterium]
MNREPRVWMVFTSLIALFLSVLPLPHWLEVTRPAFLVLVVLYFSITAPRAGGVGWGFIAGVALDIFEGTILGQHALALSLTSYVAVREHQKIRSKPAFQQSLIVFFFLVAYEFIVFAIDGWTGHPISDLTRWVHAFSGALIWPIVIALLERGHSPR